MEDIELFSRPAVVAPRHPEIDPTPGQLVQHGDVLCHPKWVPVWQNDATLTDPQLLGVGGQVGAYEKWCSAIQAVVKPASSRNLTSSSNSSISFPPFVRFGEMVLQGAVESHVHSPAQQALLLFT